MDFFIFLANDIEFHGRTISGTHITSELLAHKKWYLLSYSPYRKAMQAGDQVIFYVAGKGARHFVGTAKIAKPPYPTKREDKALLKKSALTTLVWLLI